MGDPVTRRRITRRAEVRDLRDRAVHDAHTIAEQRRLIKTLQTRNAALLARQDQNKALLVDLGRWLLARGHDGRDERCQACQALRGIANAHRTTANQEMP